MKCIGYVENDKFARASYEAMYDTTGEWTATDIKDVEPDDIPKADMWTFGFPCTDISVAGRREGLNGERSGLFYEVIRLLKGKSTEDRPEWLLCENVKNLLSIDTGRGFTEVLFEISEAGYDAQWYLVNSKDFGVPQNRERVYIIGHLRARGRFELLSEPRESRQTGSQTQPTQQARQGQEVTERQVEKYGDRFDHMIGNRKYQSSHVYGVNGVARACDTKQEIYYAIPKLMQMFEIDQANRVYDAKGLSKTITGCAGGGGAKTGYYALRKT